MIITVETSDDAQLHEVVAQDGISLKELKLCFGDEIYLLGIHLV